jgi:hypothetical protein
MINNDVEDLNEGGKYLQAYDNSFDPEDTKSRGKYSFQLIEQALLSFNLSEYMVDIIEIMVFDAIIGNSDRHQENWAFIIDLDSISTKGIAEIEKLIKYKWHKLPRIIKWFLQAYKDSKKMKLKKEFKDIQISMSIPKSFAPIYDNGSSLGRELLEERVNLLNSQPEEMLKYIKRGKSEIHWENKKIDHFSLLNEILSSNYANELKIIVKRVIIRYESEKLEQLIFDLDKNSDKQFSEYNLPQNRKEVIFKMIDLRISKLKQFTN